MALPDLKKAAPKNWTASCVITGHLVSELMVQEEFRTIDHSAHLQEGRTATLKWSVLLEEEDLAETLAGAPSQGAHLLRWEMKTGSWMTVQPSTVSGTELGVQEWRYALFLKYGLELPDFPH